MTAPIRPWYACNANPCTCPKPGSALDLSPAEAARVAEFDAAPEPPEIVVERVARAIWEADFCAEHVAWENDAERNREDYRRLAAAAVAALTGGRVA